MILPRSLCGIRRQLSVSNLHRVFVICLLLAGSLSQSFTFARAMQNDEANISPALRLWREVEPVIAQDEGKARAALARDPATARALYRELLFDAVDARLYDGCPLSPNAERVRVLLAPLDAESAALEAKFAQWTPNNEHKPGGGFTADGTDFEQLLYLYIAAAQQNVDRTNEAHPAHPVTSRALTERALALADKLNVELVSAACANNLASIARNERRRDDMPPFIEGATAIWERWRHPAGRAGIAFLRAEHAALAENWKEAATSYRRAAELAVPLLPNFRSFRIAALNGLAWSLRNAGDQAGVVAALNEVVAEQQKLVAETDDQDKRASAARNLAAAQIELGEALAALGRHTEAGEWYTRADQLRTKTYQAQRAQMEATINEWEGKLKAARSDPKLDDAKRKFEIASVGTMIDIYLTPLASAAGDHHDSITLVKLAELRGAAARASNDAGKLADALDGLAKAQLAAGYFKQARTAGEEARTLRMADPRRKFLYNTVAQLADIAAAAEDLKEAVALYHEVIELAKPGALPAPYDLAVGQDESIRQTRARMNAKDQVYRLLSALQARLALGDIEEIKGNYSAADEQYTQIARELPKLYAAGAPDEQQLLRWLDERVAQAETQPNADWSLKWVDVAAHRKQTSVVSDAGELKRMQQAELLVNSMRATVALKRAGLLYAEGDLVAAAQAYRDAIKQVTNVLGGSFPLVGAYLSLAQIERERGNYEAAEAPLTTALAASQRQHDAANVAGILAQVAVLRRRQGRLDEARRLAEDALKLGRDVNSRAELASLLQTIGGIESEQGGASLPRAEQHLREALALARDLGERARVAYTLSDLGWTLESAGREREALMAYQEAVRLVESLTASLSKDVSAEVFSTKRGNRELYERLIRLLIKHGRAADALGYLERAKAKSLVEALAGAEINAREPQLKQLIRRVRAASDAVRSAEAALTTETARPVAQRDAAKIKTAQGALAHALADYEAAVAELQRANPAYASLVAVRATDVEQIRRSLPPRTLLVEYFPTATTLYIFTLTHNTVPAARAVPIKHVELAELIMQYRAVVATPRRPAAATPVVYARSTRGLILEEGKQAEVKQAAVLMQTITGKLYDLLFAPVQAQIDQAHTLLLVPAAELYYLPLHALGRLQPDGSISFLIEQKRFAYLAAADTVNTVAAVNANSRALSRQGLLALGNPDGSLPGAAEEVKTLSRIFPQADVYTGADATLQRIASAQLTRPVPYIHFATHGMLNSSEPKESYLLLAGKPGRLSVKDLVEDTYGMSFNGTRLVTLSACQTSIGGWDPSAVYSSLSRAFAKAGAPTVVASLWSVSDISTRDTMTVFYKELAAGQSKAEAMRRAQLAVLHAPRFAHPFFWAPFIVLGDWR